MSRILATQVPSRPVRRSPPAGPERIKAVIGSAEAPAELDLELARESVALLKNDGALPFAANTAKRIAVVGPLADDAQNQLGDWTGKLPRSGLGCRMASRASMITTVLDGFLPARSDDCEVVYSRGRERHRLGARPGRRVLPGWPASPENRPSPPRSTSN